MSTERSLQSYSREELCDQRTNLIREKQQAEERVKELSERSDRAKSYEKLKT